MPEGGAAALVRSVVGVTLAVEALGAALLWLAWRDTLGNAGAIWPALFHAVSAFCNAGFSTFRDNLVGSANDLPVLAVIAA